MKHFGYVYIWRDRLTKKFYIGSHIGVDDDGYISGSIWDEYSKRPEDFKKRILWRLYDRDYSLLRAEEARWLSMVRDDEVGVRYYNRSKRMVNTGKRRVRDPETGRHTNTAYAYDCLSRTPCQSIGCSCGFVPYKRGARRRGRPSRAIGT